MAKPKKKAPLADPAEMPETALPERIPLMPIKSTVVFPTGATSLQIGFTPNVEVLTRYGTSNQAVALVHSSEEDLPIEPATLEKVGVLARILNRLNLPGGTVQTTVQGLIRVQITDVRFENDHYTGRARLVSEIPVSEEDASELTEHILTRLGGIGANIERLADVPRILRSNLGDPGRFADLVATLAHFMVDDKDTILQKLDVQERLQFVASRLDHEWGRLKDHQEREGRRPPRESGEAPDKASSIRRQIATLQAELGEIDPAERDAITALRRIEKIPLPARVAARARSEAERLRIVPPMSHEAADIRSYLDFLLELPWAVRSEQHDFDPDRVMEVLDREHLGLEEVKRRIVEFVSLAKLRKQVTGPIPCIVGPPEVGKRSLAEAVAQGLGRPLVRLELGGRGEEQLIGRRRTRSGARPGKIIEGFHEAGVRDPVYLLEEIDELGLGNVEGDPVEALEEALEPESRAEFVDRYVDTHFDLSETIFIATANDFGRIPRSIRQLLSEIRIAGYTSEEKLEIARARLLPRMIEGHGLSPSDVEIGDDVLQNLIRAYARDSGLGHLRRALGAILRFAAHRKAQGIEDTWQLDDAAMEEILGAPRYATTEAESAPEVGVVTGLAWTASGGELMFIEALKMPGTGRLIITGRLGEVMRESVNAAYSYVRSRAEVLGIPEEIFADSDIHIHFPVGATPKDGPSAGVAVTLAIASSLSDRPVRHDVAMTGEVTLRGKILEIGGVKEKTLSAYRAGLRQVILPTANQRDLRDVPTDVRDGMEFHFVDHMDQIFEIALIDPGKKKSRPRRRKSSPGRKKAEPVPEKIAAEGGGEAEDE